MLCRLRRRPFSIIPLATRRATIATNPQMPPAIAIKRADGAAFVVVELVGVGEPGDPTMVTTSSIGIEPALMNSCPMVAIVFDEPLSFLVVKCPAYRISAPPSVLSTMAIWVMCSLRPIAASCADFKRIRPIGEITVITGTSADPAEMGYTEYPMTYAFPSLPAATDVP
jgi:hypothetical protein